MPAGRPPKFSDSNADEAQKIIDKFFEECQGKPIMIKDPETDEEVPYLDKYGQPVLIGVKPPTVTGLCLAMGFNSRNALLDYEHDEENPQLANTITRAKMRCQEYAETRLYDKDGANGAKFSLQNNFGWVERTEVTNTNIEVDLLPEDRRARIAALLKRNFVEMGPTTYSVLPEKTDDPSENE